MSNQNKRGGSTDLNKGVEGVNKMTRGKDSISGERASDLISRTEDVLSEVENCYEDKPIKISFDEICSNQDEFQFVIEEVLQNGPDFEASGTREDFMEVTFFPDRLT